MNFVPVVYAGGGPVLASSGAQRVACPDMVTWFATYDALQVFRGRGHATVYQAQGTATAASAGTHSCGSTIDLKYVGTDPIMDAREMGGWFWPRLWSLGWPKYDSNGNLQGEHVHGGISCGHNSCNQYQADAYRLGYNGLGLNGLAAGDPLPKPKVRRTWQEGIAWAKAQMTTAPTITKDDDMPIFIRTTDTSIWLLKPGAEPRGLSGEEWDLWVRLGATRNAEDMNMLQMQNVNEMLQPAPVVATVDADAVAKAVAALLPESTVDVDAIAKAVRAAIIKE